MFELAGLFISGVGAIHDLLRTYSDLRTWKEQDLKVDEKFLVVAIEKGILPGPVEDYTWPAEDKIPTRELQGTHEVVVAFNEEKKVKYRLRLGESMLLTRRVAPTASKV